MGDEIEYEHSILESKCKELFSFMGTQRFKDLPIDEQGDLKLQFVAMTDYERVLWRRLQRAKSKNGDIFL